MNPKYRHYKSSHTSVFVVSLFALFGVIVLLLAIQFGDMSDLSYMVTGEYYLNGISATDSSTDSSYAITFTHDAIFQTPTENIVVSTTIISHSKTISNEGTISNPPQFEQSYPQLNYSGFFGTETLNPSQTTGTISVKATDTIQEFQVCIAAPPQNKTQFRKCYTIVS